MSHIRVLICCVDDPDSDQMTELAAFDFPAADVSTLQPETALDELETSTQETRNAILRRVLQAQWDIIDAELTERHRQQFSPQVVHDDGHESVTVGSRFSQRVPALTLSRQLCSDPLAQSHVMPGNAALPPHHGIIITRGLQAWACLLPQELPFVRSPAYSAGRLKTMMCSPTPRSAASCELTARSSAKPNGRKSQRWLPRTILRAWT